jgi:hypothetical protein
LIIMPEHPPNTAAHLPDLPPTTPRRTPLVPERSDFLEGDAPATAKVEAFLAGALEAVGSDANITAGALVPWICDALLSNHSVKAYGRDLMDFLRHMQAQGVTALDVTADHVKLYKRALLEAGMTSATVARRLSVLRGTYKQLAAKGLVSWETAQDIAAIKASGVQKNSTPSLVGNNLRGYHSSSSPGTRLSSVGFSGQVATRVAWTRGLMVVNLDGRGRPIEGRDQERRLGVELRISTSEAWPSEVRSFLGPTSSMPQVWGQSRGTSASTKTLPAQGMRETLSSHPSPSQVLQPRVPRGRSSLATSACQPAVSADH